MHLKLDANGIPAQGFATKKIVSVNSGFEWTPDQTDIAFRVPVNCGYYLGADNLHVASLLAGAITVIGNGKTFTFDATLEIEVM